MDSARNPGLSNISPSTLRFLRLDPSGYRIRVVRTDVRPDLCPTRPESPPTTRTARPIGFRPGRLKREL